MGKTREEIFEELAPRYKDALVNSKGSAYASQVSASLVGDTIIVSSHLFEGDRHYNTAEFKKVIEDLESDPQFN